MLDRFRTQLLKFDLQLLKPGILGIFGENINLRCLARESGHF